MVRWLGCTVVVFGLACGSAATETSGAGDVSQGEAAGGSGGETVGGSGGETVGGTGGETVGAGGSDAAAAPAGECPALLQQIGAFPS